MRAVESVSSAEARKGDLVEFRVVQDILVEGVPVIPRGTMVQGMVSEVKRKRRLARGGELGIVLESVGLASGEQAPVRATTQVRGGSHSNRMATGMAVTARAFYPAAPILLLMHGKECVLLKGASLTAYVNGDVLVDLGKIENVSARLPQGKAALLSARAASRDRSAAISGHSRVSAQEIIESIPRRILDSSGNEGDMINLMFVGTQEQIEVAFRQAGWVTTLHSKGHAVFHAVRHPKNQVAMPMSRLYLFGRPQDFGLAMEDPASKMTRRHHIRIWRTDDDLNGVPVWVGAATHDIGVERDKRSFTGITHEIDPNVDAERELVGKLLREVQVSSTIGYLVPADVVRQATTATGGAYYSDGKVLLMVMGPAAEKTGLMAQTLPNSPDLPH